MRFEIDSSVLELFPRVELALVVARGLDNGRESAAIADSLREAARAASAQLGEADVAAHAAVAPWRAAYARFGAKPSKFRSSIESLLRSARKGEPRAISPLVDLYNAISLRHLLPCGGEDLDRVRGALRLMRAAGGEAFVPLGASAPEPPEPGEVVYLDDEGAICRCWNWREAERTKLTRATRNALLCIEALPEAGPGAAERAGAELARWIEAELGGTTRLELLSEKRPATEL